ncbi:2Fe-2S iron-sulfur cluster-binding protein [Phenylobacterium sp. J367]|uniref:2Fe-2S iron-sulfur cluster-binding protein n=1 Tax=Phenylobacterium sp. J367 TaxID=2898435 RepID=UPI002151E339|nr:2Fe-2S iron-sulfur cluster-binding protein [Phenylobacterium sp. J367]MCR5879563.1 2Fe-2S iron-sulfur cluster-binding protein [Phenylobacterium sp. J367]
MPNVEFLLADGGRRVVAAKVGESLMYAATRTLTPGIVAECGGNLSCGTCHVFVDAAWSSRLPPKSEEEEMVLEGVAEEPTEHSRLSCQIRMTAELDGIVVQVPASQR